MLSIFVHNNSILSHIVQCLVGNILDTMALLHYKLRNVSSLYKLNAHLQAFPKHFAITVSTAEPLRQKAAQQADLTYHLAWLAYNAV